MTAPVRRPRSLPARSLAEHLLDLDNATPQGEGDVELPGEIWAQLVKLASSEYGAKGAPFTNGERRELEELRKFRENATQQLERAHVESQTLENDLEVARLELADLRKFKAANALGPVVLPAGVALSTLVYHGRAHLDFGDSLLHVELEGVDAARLVDELNHKLVIAGKTTSLSSGEAFEPIPPPKKKRARTHKAFCGKCNATTPHDGNDDCTKCPREPVQTDLEEAVAEVTP